MKIISDGLIANTKITTDDGHVIDGVTRLVITGNGGEDFLEAVLVIKLSSLNIEIRDDKILAFGKDTDEQLVRLVEMQKNIRGERESSGFPELDKDLDEDEDDFREGNW